jgi:hypothetical protein
MTNTENESADQPARRELRLMLAAGGHWPGPIEQRLDAHRTENLNEAIEAARGEYLHDQTGTPEDEAYNQAVSDVVAAIGALLEGGQ